MCPFSSGQRALWTLGGCVLLLAWGAALAWGQASLSDGTQRSPANPSRQEQAIDPAPRVKLIYYPGGEGGGWKDVRYIRLNDWTPQHDVYLEFSWRKRPGGKVGSLWATWTIRYKPAAQSDRPQVIVTGLGRTYETRIYGEEDLIILLRPRGLEWFEIGAAARLYRHLQRQQPPPDTQNPTAQSGGRGTSAR